MPVKITRLKSGLCKVETPRGVKSYGTICDKAEGQARLLRAIEHENPEERQIDIDHIIAEVPPIYKLNWMETWHGESLRPAFPIQLLPQGYGEVIFKFWGMNTYDVHSAFPGVLGNAAEYVDPVRIRSINYQIVVFGGGDKTSICAHYQHNFIKQTPELGYKGLSGHRPIFKFYRALEHLPKLPHDWQYLQFIN